MERVKAVKESIASLRMEGFIFTDEELDVLKKLANGEISCNDVKKVADDNLKRWQKENPECFTSEK